MDPKLKTPLGDNFKLNCFTITLLLELLLTRTS